MNASVMQENLTRGLSTVSRAFSTRATLPVLANILLKTEDSGLKLTATNLEIGINCWVPGKVEAEGEITVPAKLLTDLVSSLPNQRIDMQLSAKDRTLKVSCGGSRSSIKGIDADEFPVVAAIGDSPATSVEARQLRDALGEVVFAAASDESRPILTGVLTRLSGEAMTLAAADNYRIAVRTVPTSRAVSPELSIVMPARSYAELMRILVDEQALAWEKAWDLTRAVTTYTNHTLLPEALEKWPVELFGRVLPRHLEIVYEINRRFIDEVRRRFPGDAAKLERLSLIDEHGERYVRMANLACVGSRAINGVATSVPSGEVVVDVP